MPERGAANIEQNFLRHFVGHDLLRVAGAEIDRNGEKEGAGCCEQGRTIATSRLHALVDSKADDQRDEKLRAGEDQHRGNRDYQVGAVGPHERPNASDNILVKRLPEHLLFDAMGTDGRMGRTPVVAGIVGLRLDFATLEHQLTPSWLGKMSSEARAWRS
ncbi:hypothetical protein MPL3365_170287 [Mesorhizobium plurifarium]|uniref:Uncharacterized protein n=1 Tax=Mesorhizobium plurifarium TaxID=69974 RepID=A0A090G647_MESPL|nr:hypothetical protein MPL3365_170287 [Mesorhizobium plurifarium]